MGDDFKEDLKILMNMDRSSICSCYRLETNKGKIELEVSCSDLNPLNSCWLEVDGGNMK